MDKLDELIAKLYADREEAVPFFESQTKARQWRSLVNTRPPKPIGQDYLELEDEYLQERLSCLEVTTLDKLNPFAEDLYLWKGDITLLAVDGIVNAANSELLGCFAPCHNCIDNCIHTFAGVRLRLECDRIMREQGHPEKTGRAKITPAYNLPSRYVLHTVGPIVTDRVTMTARKQLASCYTECLKLADENGLESIAFCCISTGVFGYPKEDAAKVAIKAVKHYKAKTGSRIKVIFDVYSDEDLAVYQKVLNHI